MKSQVPLGVLVEAHECLCIANNTYAERTTADLIRIAKATGALRYYVNTLLAEQAVEVTEEAA